MTLRRAVHAAFPVFRAASLITLLALSACARPAPVTPGSNAPVTPGSNAPVTPGSSAPVTPDSSRLARSGPRGIDTLTILHTNDMHAHVSPEPAGIAGLAKLAGYMNAVREGRKDVLALDAGDVITGSPLSSISQGQAIFDLVNLLRFDAGVLGNHEYDHGWKNIPTLIERATYPILCANAFRPDGQPMCDGPTLIRDIDGVRVGIIGLITEHTPRYTVNKGNEGIRFERAVDAARRLVPRVDQEADLVIALTHQGYDEDKQLARAVPGIDVIVGGHSHTAAPKPLRVGDTWIVQAHEYTKKVGRIDLKIDLDTEQVLELEGGLITLADLPIAPDPVVAEAVAKAESTVSSALDVVLAEATQELGKRELAEVIEAAMKALTGAELAVMNDGGIQGRIAAGPITLRALWSVLPFDNTVVHTRIEGRQLSAEARSRFERRGVAIDPGKTYVLVTNSYVADHADNFLGPKSLRFEDTGATLRDTVAEWLKRQAKVPLNGSPATP